MVRVSQNNGETNSRTGRVNNLTVRKFKYCKAHALCVWGVIASSVSTISRVSQISMERPPFVPFTATTMMWHIYRLPITSRLAHQHTLFAFKFLARAVGGQFQAYSIFCFATAPVLSKMTEFLRLCSATRRLLVRSSFKPSATALLGS